ncbi:protein of unknown function [Candidatus Nitrosocosmicus franklandus]|uniref:Uncharacterized protein n=1 Tax=Candidatus Nitrosocosmicus franklandianus TaxID=1798806 RepID=A0A484IFE4_9ARCH|nr:protein of unknown function [Candidatus Nitrosocosmicus franklandus]
MDKTMLSLFHIVEEYMDIRVYVLVSQDPICVKKVSWRNESKSTFEFTYQSSI